MRRLLLLVSKDLKRKLRAPVGLIVLLAFPLVFAGMLALVFGSGGDAMPKVRLVVENRDTGFAASALSSAFTSKQMAEHFDVRTVGKGEGAAVIEAGEASALLVIPEHLTQDVLDGKGCLVMDAKGTPQRVCREGPVFAAEEVAWESGW